MTQIAGTWIGKPLDRVDGPLKVQGKAPYAAEHRPEPRALTGWIVESAIGKGRIAAIDASRAEAAAGVAAVVTHHNAPDQAPWGSPDSAMRFTQSHALLTGPEIRHYAQPVALVVAETLEAARHAAGLVDVEYDAEDGVFEAGEEADRKPASLDGGLPPDAATGEFDAAYNAAATKLDLRYTTPNQHASPMEPHATLARWEGERLTVWPALQILSSGVQCLANTFRIDPENVRIHSPYIGGGFGSKLGLHYDAILAAIGAKVTGRPVRVVQTRRNMFFSAPHRGNSAQRVQLAADADGTLQAVGHEAWAPVARGYDFAAPTAAPCRASYAAPAILSRHRVKPVDMPAVDSMRAPGDAIGSLAFESAMDELAHELGMDPLDLRLKNEPKDEPASGKPFASRDLADCLREGARRFGWDQRKAEPGTLRRDGKQVGYGLASAIRFNILQEGHARVRLGANGGLTVQMDMTDIGTGSYTILTQIAAEATGLPPEAVSVEIGDSAFPQTAGSGGSFGAGTSGSALWKACEALVDKLGKAAAERGLLSGDPGAIRVEDGALTDGARSVSVAELAAQMGAVEAEGACKPGEDHQNFAQYSYGAHFAEVRIDPETCEIEVARMLGVFSAGRILNAKTARSQMIGGMVWGLSAALREELMLDARFGAFVNRDLAEYHLPVNRDVPALEVAFLETPDEKSNPLGSKGMGELAICGSGAAIANAVFNASGKRVRDFPITLEKLF